MDRKDRLMQGMTRDMAGIEVAPWLAPIAPRRDGWNVRIVDVFDTETLRQRGAADSEQNWRDMSVLEEVDFVGSATEIAALVPADLHGRIDWIVSSHNFEHLPNPIKFLQGCEAILAPGGALTMAVPDKRGCFDVFRPLTETADWIEAFFEDRRRPSPRTLMSSRSSFAGRPDPDGISHAFFIGEPAGALRLERDLAPNFAFWRDGMQGEAYEDAHVTVMTPASLELLLLDARQLGLVGLDLEWVHENGDFEFYLRLRKPADGARAALPDDAAFREARTALMRRILVEQAVHAPRVPVPVPMAPVVNTVPAPWSKRFARRLRSLSRRMRGKPERSHPAH